MAPRFFLRSPSIFRSLLFIVWSLLFYCDKTSYHKAFWKGLCKRFYISNEFLITRNCPMNTLQAYFHRMCGWKKFFEALLILLYLYGWCKRFSTRRQTMALVSARAKPHSSLIENSCSSVLTHAQLPQQGDIMRSFCPAIKPATGHLTQEADHDGEPAIWARAIR
jgi:hypothetical protein